MLSSTPPPTPSSTGSWRLWIDTGGTFTDCLALDPSGRRERVKVLSSSSLRATASPSAPVQAHRAAPGGSWTLAFEAPYDLPAGFAAGASLHWLDEPELGWPVRASSPGRLELGGSPPGGDLAGRAFELRFDEEAPILAARLITRSPDVASLPPMSLRLATTRGTNALLERRGARTVLFLTRGFGDLLRIGDQRRPDLFALRIERPAPLYERVVEVPARRTADGEVLAALELDSPDGAFDAQIERVAKEAESVAVALMHSDLWPDEEEAIERALRSRGLQHVSSSAALHPIEGYLSRARTAVVDAYLQPVIGRYLERIEGAVGESRLRVMTSAGGLVGAASYRAKDSLLSGPAGGVVGAAAAGRRLGIEKLVAFDMGGTSTDVSRFDGDFEYRYEQRVGDAQIAAPTLAIETVAAGGGSICRLEGRQLKVGPQSAGASPGPACYGVGGPLTLTDVNLLLGRLDEERFEIPIDRRAAAAALEEQVETLGSLQRDELLLGYVAIADQRMADAVRQISVRQGYDPRDYALVAFGGAGGQHACSVAELIGIGKVVLPADAGLLSAAGLGAAVIERFATRQVRRLLDAVSGEMPALLAELAAEALEELRSEGVEAADAEVRRRLASLRLRGQESSLEIECPSGDPGGAALGEALEAGFLDAYAARYGYTPQTARIELESLRVVVSERVVSERVMSGRVAAESEPRPAERSPAPAVGRRRVLFDDGWRDASVHWLPQTADGALFESPALLFDQHASLTLAPGWRAEKRGGAVVAKRAISGS